MPAGWEDMDWSFLDPVIDQADQPEQVDVSDLSTQEQEYLCVLPFDWPFGADIDREGFGYTFLIRIGCLGWKSM
jgi:hypothetical protein